MCPLSEYVCLDARNIDELLEPESVQSTVTSPPYFDTKNYGGSRNQIGWKQTYEDYLADMRLVFGKCLESTRKNGTLWVVVDTYKRAGELTLLPLDLMDALREVGWMPQDIIIWDKVKNLPYSRLGQFRNNFEYILFLSKTGDFKYYIDRIREVHNLEQWWVRYPERYNPKGKDPSNIWRIIIPHQGSWRNGNLQHLCPFPPRLVERILQLSTDEGDLVLDPFAGSGVVLAQARCMNRKSIGCDVNRDFRTQYIKKVDPEVRSMWKRREQELAVFEKQQRRFEKTNLSLRKLKFAKTLAKRLTEKFGKEVIRLMIVSSDKERAERTLQVRIMLDESFSGSIDDIRESLKIGVSSRPLSRFGLKASVRTRVVNDSSISRMRLGKYFRYLDGRFYDFSDNDDTESLMSTGTQRSPPMLSKIRVSLDEIESFAAEVSCLSDDSS